ncbi:MAG: ABC transporter ATP-binding protein [Chloroflexi bacterium]|nr:ABC transporter ATP-binding protein [Chloroflexota bacterium]
MTTAVAAPPALAARGLTCHFGGLTAVDSVDFELRQGEVLGLIGPNGAGKTTLMNLISGLTSPTSGDVLLGERRLTGLPPHTVTRLGVARTFQVMRPFQGLTVRENVAIGARFGSAGGPGNMRAALAKADDVLDWIGMAPLGRAEISRLTTGERKKLELARALAMDPTVLLLDEVMAGCNPREIGDVMELIRRVNARGVTILLIEHLMKAVMGLCHRVLVLHHGKRIALGTPTEVAEDPAVVEAYLGQRYAESRRKSNA